MPWRQQMADIPFEGIFRRQIDLRSWDARTVVAWLEDECHHFGLTLTHDGERVTAVRVATPRDPWTSCAAVGEPLQALVGQPLVARCTDLGALVDMRRQCTHVFDLAGLALALAYARRQHRRYHGTVCPLAQHRACARGGRHEAGPGLPFLPARAPGNGIPSRQHQPPFRSCRRGDAGMGRSAGLSRPQPSTAAAAWRPATRPKNDPGPRLRPLA